MITPNQYKKINNYRELEKAENNLRTWFNLFIRLRDLIKNDNGYIYGYCISCGKKWEVMLNDRKEIINNDRKWVAGHYFKENKFASVRFDEDNLSLQCYYCNKYLSGNEAEYQKNLVNKIGAERFEQLQIKKNQIKKFNIIEVNELKEKYRLLAKAEAKRLGIEL